MVSCVRDEILSECEEEREHRLGVHESIGVIGVIGVEHLQDGCEWCRVDLDAFVVLEVLADGRETCGDEGEHSFIA